MVESNLPPAPEMQSLEPMTIKRDQNGVDAIRLRRLHPLSLGFECLSLARRNLLPVLFAGFSAASGGLIGFWIGLSVFGIAILVSVFKYLTFRYSIFEDDLVIQHGLIFRQHRTIPIAHIQNIDLVQNPLHRLFGVAEVRVETASGTEPEATMRVLAVDEMQRLRTSIFGETTSDVASENSTLPATISDFEHAIETLKVGAPADSKSSQTRPASAAQLVYQIPTKELLLAGLCSNRGAVFVGLLLSFLWQERVAKMFGIGSGVGWERVPVSHGEAGEVFRHEMVRRGAAVRFLFHDLLSGHAILMPLLYLLIIVAVATVVVKTLSAIWYVLRFHGYRLEWDGEDFRVRCGLFTRVSATVPRHRIQVISIHRPWLERWVGLAHIRIETAGGGQEDEDAASTMGRRWFLPVVREGDVKRLLHQLNPAIEPTEEQYAWQALSKSAGKRVMRLGLLVSLMIAIAGTIMKPAWGWIGGGIVLVGFWWWSKKKLKSRGFARTSWGVAVKSGILYRKMTMTFFDKIQSISVQQSPLDRRWKMAGLSIDTLGAGPADHKIEIDMLDEKDAESQYRQLISQPS